MKTPYVFDEFFASGGEESISPFLTPGSRKWGLNLSLKSGALAGLFLLFAFASSFTNVHLSYFFLSFVYFLSGVPALLASINDLKNFEINIDVLMTLAAFLAVLIGSGLEGALLLVLFELSHGIEEAVSKKAKSALTHLGSLAPKFATVVASDGTLYEKSVREIAIGMHLLVKNGEVVPLDGIVKEGISSVDLVHLTGESLPVPKQVGDTVPAGARNLEGALTIEVNRTSRDSTLAKIITLITEAQEAKPKLQRFLDQFGKRYATTIIALTLCFALTLPFLFAIGYFGHEGSIYRALAFLIAASPCALIIATPTAYLSAISSCAKKGILLKGGVTLDMVAGCSLIAFDKTGTLTLGELTCTAITPIWPSSLSEEKALQIAFGLERQVVHPIASAICMLAQERKLPPAEIAHFKSVPGFGLEGSALSFPVAIGLPEHIGAKLPKDKQELLFQATQEKSSEGKAFAALLIGPDLFLFQFADTLRPSAPALISELKTKYHLRPIMLTGDHPASARRIAASLGIAEIFADLRPEDKLSKVTELSLLDNLAMVGDGVNDAPALARANVGISMGRIGSKTAVDASDVVLLNDNLEHIGWLFGKSRQTTRIVRQNITLALSVILFATTPALLGLIPLWTAVLLHEGGTVLVGLNSLRLLRK